MIRVASLILLLLICSFSVAKEYSNLCYGSQPPEDCTNEYDETLRTAKPQPPQECVICCAAAVRKACVESKCGSSYKMRWGLDIPSMCDGHWMYNSTSSPVCWSTVIWVLVGAACIIAFLVAALTVRHVIDKRAERDKPPNSIEVRPSALKKVSIKGTHNTKRVEFAAQEPQPGTSRACRVEFRTVVAQVHQEPASRSGPFEGVPGDESRIPMIDETDEEGTEEETQV